MKTRGRRMCYRVLFERMSGKGKRISDRTANRNSRCNSAYIREVCKARCHLPGEV